MWKEKHHTEKPWQLDAVSINRSIWVNVFLDLPLKLRSSCEAGTAAFPTESCIQLPRRRTIQPVESP